MLCADADHFKALMYQAQEERDAARAELERLRTVVRAAQAWKAKRDRLLYPPPRRAPESENTSIPEAADLYAAVAAFESVDR